MRFRRDSKEEACGTAICHKQKWGPFACMRTKGHRGRHIAMAASAAKADGVCHSCRAKWGGKHRKDCYASKESTW